MDQNFDLPRIDQRLFNWKYAAELIETELPSIPANVQIDLYQEVAPFGSVLLNYLEKKNLPFSGPVVDPQTIAVFDASSQVGHHIPRSAMARAMVQRFQKRLDKLDPLKTKKIVVVADDDEGGPDSADNIGNHLEAAVKDKNLQAILLHVPRDAAHWYPNEFDSDTWQYEHPLLFSAASVYYGYGMHPVDVTQAVVRACARLGNSNNSGLTLIKIGTTSEMSGEQFETACFWATHATHEPVLSELSNLAEKLGYDTRAMPEYPDLENARRLLGYNPLYKVERILREACELRDGGIQ